VAEVAQLRRQQAEMHRFFGRHLQPVAVIGGGHAGEAPDRVEREVDGIELDVGNGVHHRGQAVGREGRAAGHVGCRYQRRARRPPWQYPGDIRHFRRY